MMKRVMIFLSATQRINDDGQTTTYQLSIVNESEQRELQIGTGKQGGHNSEVYAIEASFPF